MNTKNTISDKSSINNPHKDIPLLTDFVNLSFQEKTKIDIESQGKDNSYSSEHLNNHTSNGNISGSIYESFYVSKERTHEKSTQSLPNTPNQSLNNIQPSSSTTKELSILIYSNNKKTVSTFYEILQSNVH